MFDDPRDVLLAPVISEKSYGLLDENKYTFEVHPEANKTQIKIAVEKVFSVKVTDVNTLNRQGKRKRTRYGYGTAQEHQARHRDLRDGDRIDMFGQIGELRLTMAIRKYKPTTPGRRGSSVSDFAEITRDAPEKSLVRPLHNKGGRNNTGRVTTRHQGGGHKRAYRVIDFRRARQGRRAGQGRAHRVRPEPHRPHRAAALRRRREALHHRAARLKQGDQVENGPSADIKPGNNLPLRNIPAGTIVHAIELRPGGGAKIARSAGASVQLVAKDGPYAQLRMPSGEIRNVDVRCRATVGEVGNAEQSNINWGKAGRMRWKGKRPTVRGVAMNPVDHPHGGGEGKTSGGRHPVNPNGKPEGRTRRRKASDRMIVRRRRTNKKR